MHVVIIESLQNTEFEHLTGVIDAIEAFTALAVAANPPAFHYRGVDLRHALERALYIRFANDADAFDRFVESGGVSQKASLRTALRRRTGIELRRLTHRLMHAPGRIERSRRCLVERPPVLIHVIHEKFVRYLQPVVARLRSPYAYLAVLNDRFPCALDDLGVPFIDATAIDPPSNRVAPPLADHGELPAWYDRVYQALSRLRPRCVVLVEGNAAQDEVVNRACRTLGIPTVCVQHGWSPFVHNGFRNMTYTQMAVWGDGFAEMLRPFNPNQRFATTGHVGLRAASAGGGAVGFFLQAPGPLITERAWSEFLWLIRRTAEELPHRRIVVREHPVRPLGETEKRGLSCANIELAPPAKEELAAILPQFDVVASIYSTVLLEGLAAGAVPVVVNLTSMPAYLPDVAGAGAGVEVHDANAALAAISRLTTDRDYRDSFQSGMCEFRERFFASAESPADRIADLIEAHVGL